MAQETLREIIEEKKRPLNKIGLILIILVVVAGLLVGAYLLIGKLANSSTTFLNPIGQSQPQTSSSPLSTPSALPTASNNASVAPSAAEALSESDDTSTLQKELDSTATTGPNSSDTVDIDNAINQL